MTSGVRDIRALRVVVLLGACCFQPVEAQDRVDFEARVAPVLIEKCVRCHQPGNSKGDLSLATPAMLLEQGLMVPGKPEESHLLAVVSPDGNEPPQMPRQGTPLTAEEIHLLRTWIEQGAEWPEAVVLREKSQADRSWWSLQPVKPVELPSAEGIPPEWSSHPIDRFIARRLIDEGLSVGSPADKATLLRRVSYGLTGLPPMPAEREAFLNDQEPEAFARVVDQLLESPRYGEHWGRHWLDVVRFGESNGFERNVLIDTLWPFRDYIIRSWNEDKPYDRLIREHLAGDVLSPGDPAVEVGTAFLVCGPYDNVGNQDPVQAAQIRANTVDEIVRATAETFLGLTVGCARCHDHKFDPILQEDYYSLYATLNGVSHGNRTVATPEMQQQRQQQVEPIQARKQELQVQIEVLEKSVRERGDAKSAEYAATWQREAVDRTGTEEVFDAVKAQHLRFIVEGRDDAPAARTGYRLDEFEVWSAEEPVRNVALAENGGRAEGASRVAGDFAGAYGPELTIDGRFGARWIATGDTLLLHFAEPTLINRVLFSSDRQASLQENPKMSFVAEYRVEVSLDGESWTEVASSRDRKPVNEAHRVHRIKELEITREERMQLGDWRRELAELDRQLAALPPYPTWWLGTFRQPEGVQQVHVGGDPQKPGVAVVPGSLSVLEGCRAYYRLEPEVAESARRLALAESLVEESHPLTSRVIVNRVWQWHFGTGLVGTSSDFGVMGERPSHPELLDWLAMKFKTPVEQGGCGWSFKTLHRLILSSRTYQQSGLFREKEAQVDGQARLLWRFSPRRLGAEEIRDSILSISGRLNLTQGGPGFRLYRYIEDNVATYVPLDEWGPETYRRAVYHQNARAAPVDMMAEFDCPDPASAVPVRASTTTPLQALTMLNHRFTYEMANAVAERLQQEIPDDPRRRIQQLFVLSWNREAEGAELEFAERLVDQHGLAALARALINSNEFLYLQ